MEHYNLTEKQKNLILENHNNCSLLELSKRCNCKPIHIYKFCKAFNLSYKKNAFELTMREIEIMELAVKGLSNREIYTKLCISPLTLKSHFKNIYGKFDIECNKGDSSIRVRAVLSYLRKTGQLIDD